MDRRGFDDSSCLYINKSCEAILAHICLPFGFKIHPSRPVFAGPGSAPPPFFLNLRVGVFGGSPRLAKGEDVAADYSRWTRANVDAWFFGSWSL